MTGEDITDLLRLIRDRADLVTVTGAVQMCRDPDDDLVIETALVGRADTLITRDDDLKDDRDLREGLAALGVEVMSVQRALQVLSAYER